MSSTREQEKSAEKSNKDKKITYDTPHPINFKIKYFKLWDHTYNKLLIALSASNVDKNVKPT